MLFEYEIKNDKKINKLISGGHLLEPLEYKLQEEKDANCEKLYCCRRKSCEL